MSFVAKFLKPSQIMNKFSRFSRMSKHSNLMNKKTIFGNQKFLYCTRFSPKTNNRFLGLSLALGGFTSFASYKSLQNAKAMDHEVDNHFHLLEALTEISSKISPTAMLKMFQTMVDDLGDETKISLDLLTELFKMVGVEDHQVAEHLFHTMDWDHSGFLEPSEVAAVMTLFQQGNDTNRYKFLFDCIDLNGNHEVDKNEFRSLLTALLEAHYKLQGLNDPFLPQEIFSNIIKGEYHTVAKWRANRLVMDIFNYADVNRDGVLSQKEFLKWCRRGGREVEMLRDILKDTFAGVY